MAVFVRDQRVPKCKMNGNPIMKQIELEFNFMRTGKQISTNESKHPWVVSQLSPPTKSFPCSSSSCRLGFRGGGGPGPPGGRVDCECGGGGGVGAGASPGWPTTPLRSTPFGGM